MPGMNGTQLRPITVEFCEKKRCQTFSATEPPHVAPKSAQSSDPEQVNVRLHTDLTLEKPLS